MPLADQVLSPSRIPLMLFAAAGIGLLIIGCANVSNLVLTGLESRGTELAMRASLGASPRTLLLQVLAESLVLAVAGGLVGILFAAVMLSASEFSK